MKTTTKMKFAPESKVRLSLEEEQKLARQIQAGSKPAKDLLVKHNLPLVAYVARKHKARAESLGYSYEDMIQDGIFGLMTAADKYDPDMGFRFSTYAWRWISQSISRTMQNTATTIRVPVHMQDTCNKLRVVFKSLTHLYGEEPTVNELASFLELPLDQVERCYGYLRAPVSLDAPIGSDSENTRTVADYVPDHVPNAEEKAEGSAASVVVRTILRTLTSREEYVLRARFGM